MIGTCDVCIGMGQGLQIIWNKIRDEHQGGESILLSRVG